LVKRSRIAARVLASNLTGRARVERAEDGVLFPEPVRPAAFLVPPDPAGVLVLELEAGVFLGPAPDDLSDLELRLVDAFALAALDFGLDAFDWAAVFLAEDFAFADSLDLFLAALDFVLDALDFREALGFDLAAPDLVLDALDLAVGFFAGLMGAGR
jgi:hypothetical protein